MAAVSGVRAVFRGGPIDGRIRMVEQAARVVTLKLRAGGTTISHVYVRGEVVADATVYDYHGMG